MREYIIYKTDDGYHVEIHDTISGAVHIWAETFGSADEARLFVRRQCDVDKIVETRISDRYYNVI